MIVPHDHVCNSRNPFPAQLYAFQNYTYSWVCDDIEVDYKSDDLTALTLATILRDRFDAGFPASKRLMTNDKSKIFIYLNGHGVASEFKI